jgi:hypothetical protein
MGILQPPWQTRKRDWEAVLSTTHVLSSGTQAIQMTLTTGQTVRSGLSPPRCVVLSVLLAEFMSLAVGTGYVDSVLQQLCIHGRTGAHHARPRGFLQNCDSGCLSLRPWFCVGVSSIRTPLLPEADLGLICTSPLLFASMGEVTIFRTLLPFPLLIKLLALSQSDTKMYGRVSHLQDPIHRI